MGFDFVDIHNTGFLTSFEAPLNVSQLEPRSPVPEKRITTFGEKHPLKQKNKNCLQHKETNKQSWITSRTGKNNSIFAVLETTVVFSLKRAGGRGRGVEICTFCLV